MPKPKTAITALRAVSALVLKRLLHPMMLMTIIVLGGAYVLMILLVLSFSIWWLLLLIILIPLTLIFGILGYILWYLLQRLMPKEVEKDDREKLGSFTDKVFTLVEKTKTPYPVTLFLIGKDVIRGKESAYIGGLIGDSNDLIKKFEEIQEVFRSK